MVKNLSTKAGDMGSILGPGRSRAVGQLSPGPQLLNLSSRARELQILKSENLEPEFHSKRSPHSLQQEKAHTQQ